MKLFPEEVDAFTGPLVVADMARIHARLGNRDEARRLVRTLLESPAGLALSVPFLELDPAFDGLS